MPGLDKPVSGVRYSDSAEFCRLDPEPAVELPRTGTGEPVVWIGSDARLLIGLFRSIVEPFEGVGAIAADRG